MFLLHLTTSDLEQIPGPQLVPGVLQDVPQCQSQHGRVLNLLEVEQEGNLIGDIIIDESFFNSTNAKIR